SSPCMRSSPPLSSHAIPMPSRCSSRSASGSRTWRSPRSSTTGRWRAGASSLFDAAPIAATIGQAQEESAMAFHPPSYDDIVNSKYATAMPATTVLPQTETRNYFQAIDNLIKVYAIRPTDKVLFLTDPLLDRRVVDAISGIANSRGVFPREFMAPTTQI